MIMISSNNNKFRKADSVVERTYLEVKKAESKQKNNSGGQRDEDQRLESEPASFRSAESHRRLTKAILRLQWLGASPNLNGKPHHVSSISFNNALACDCGQQRKFCVIFVSTRVTRKTMGIPETIHENIGTNGYSGFKTVLLQYPVKPQADNAVKATQVTPVTVQQICETSRYFYHNAIYTSSN